MEERKMKLYKSILTIAVLALFITGCGNKQTAKEISPQEEYQTVISDVKEKVAYEIAQYIGVSSVKLNTGEVKILEFDGTRAGIKYKVPISGKYYYTDKYGDISDFERFEAYCYYHTDIYSSIYDELQSHVEICYGELDGDKFTSGGLITIQNWDGSKDKILYSE